MKMSELVLYDHNIPAYEKAETMLAEYGKAVVIHPTGTGKSYIAFALVLAHREQRFLWIAPSEYIYSLQTAKLAKEQGISLENVEFHTYAWLMRNEGRFAELAPEYIILDEFHRAGAAEWGQSVRRLIAMYPQAKLFGMSATNVRYLDNQRDMADELFEGAVASEMSICEAMARRILPEPKYVISVYSYEEKLQGYEKQAVRLKNSRQRSRAEKLVEKLRRALQQAGGLGKVFEKHIPAKDAKLIVFCSNTEHMAELLEKVPEWFGRIDAQPHVYQVHTNNPDSEEDFRRFVEDGSGHLKLLYCIDMLNEGIHVDDVDAVVLCRPTVSPIVYKQQIGRALAAGSVKRPVVFDMVNNFDNLYQIDALKEEFDELVQLYGAGEAGGGEVIGGFEVIDELRDCRELMDQIQRNLDSAWDIYYQELCRYVKANGTARVARRYVTDDGLYLGMWLQRQRAIYNENSLPEARVKLLEAAGVIWDSDSDERFRHWMELLAQYKKEHGNLEVPHSYVTAGGERLGHWCFNTRAGYRRGRIAKERIEALDAIGFVWQTFDLYWEEGLEHAKAYYEANGDLAAAKRYECADGFRLGQWLDTQRKVRSGKASGNLTEERIEKLNALGMVWSSRKNDRFDHYLRAFLNYKMENADALIPSHYTDADGVQLGQWAARMNRMYFSGKLPEEKREQLVKAGFVFHSFTGAWRTHYLAAQEYYREHGDLCLPVSYVQEHGSTLAQWINGQRQEYRKKDHGKLTGEQVKLLEAIRIDGGGRAEKCFDRGSEAFRAYVEKHGDNLVPSEYVTPDGYKLGRWLCQQRHKYKKGDLSADQIRELEDIGMVWESTETVRAVRQWNVMYQTAKEYADVHGSLRGMPRDYVTRDGRKLGTWIAQQRRIRRGTVRHAIELDEERVGMLDAIGMNWGRDQVPDTVRNCPMEQR